MKRYRVRLTAYANGGGSTMEVPCSAYSEIHACQMIQAQYPTWFVVAAYEA